MEPIRQNMHIHSDLSGCASKDMTMEAIIKAADEAGLESIAIVDHIDRVNPKRDEQVFLNLLRYHRLIEEEEEMGEAHKVNVLIGAEVSQITPSTFAMGDATAELLDFVLVSSNHYHLGHVEKPSSLSPSDYARHYLDMLEGVLDWGYADAIAHPFHLHKVKGIDHGEVLKNYDFGRINDIMWKAMEKGVAFEVCPRHCKKHIDWFAELIFLADRVGPPHYRFCVGTDAHKLSQVGYSDEDLRVLDDIGLQRWQLKYFSE